MFFEPGHIRINIVIKMLQHIKIDIGTTMTAITNKIEYIKKHRSDDSLQKL